MKFENRFLSFIKEKKSVCAAALAAVLVLLLLLGTDSEKTVEASGADSYGEMLEERVERLISDVDGVGRCKVMITFECGERKIYEGSREVGIIPPRVLAVTVLCDGAGRVSVVRSLTETLSEMFDIGTHKVRVLKIN